jgi:hypothetical protein
MSNGDDHSRRKGKFQLRQRRQANGLQYQRKHLCTNDDEVHVSEQRTHQIRR